jgi:predicted NBD/HSP70 family sugar kinase
MDLTDVRRHHLSLILGTLVGRGPLSRAELAQGIGLTKGTVSSLVADLLDRHLVEELDTPRAGRVGRPGTAVAVSGRTVGGVGIEIGVDHVSAVVVDLTGGSRSLVRHDVDNRDRSTDEVLDGVRRVTASVLAAAEEQQLRCAGAALAVPGLVDPATGTVVVTPNLRRVDGDLSVTPTELGLPPTSALTIDNEANLGALAELRAGAGRGVSSLVYQSGGRGVGAGIVWDGRLVRGSHGFAGEVGHVVVDPAGAPCSCGARGCLETVAGAGAGADDATVADALAVALRSVVHVLDPEVLVLGGTLAQRGPDFADAVRDRLSANTLGASWSPPDVRTSGLGAEAALLGAAAVTLDAVTADPTLVPIVASTDSRTA